MTHQYFVFRLCSDRKTVMSDREEEGVKYKEAFLGNELVDWITRNKDAASRQDAVKLCRRLLENDVIRHGGWPFIYRYNLIVSVLFSFIFRGSNIWNTLRENFQKANSVTSLKSMIKTF